MFGLSATLDLLCSMCSDVHTCRGLAVAVQQFCCVLACWRLSPVQLENRLLVPRPSTGMHCVGHAACMLSADAPSWMLHVHTQVRSLLNKVCDSACASHEMLAAYMAPPAGLWPRYAPDY